MALFNLAIDSKLRGCDVVSVKVEDVAPRGYAIDRATIRQSIDELLAASRPVPGDFLFRGQRSGSHLTTRQYARLLSEWLLMIGLDPALFGTHSLRGLKKGRSTSAPPLALFCTAPEVDTGSRPVW